MFLNKSIEPVLSLYQHVRREVWSIRPMVLKDHILAPNYMVRAYTHQELGVFYATFTRVSIRISELISEPVRHSTQYPCISGMQQEV